MLLEAQEYKKHTGYPSPCQDDGTPAGGTGMTSGAASRHGASQPESRRAHNGKWYTIEEFQAYYTHWEWFWREALKRADSPGASQPGLSTLTDPCAELQTATHGAAPLVTPGATTTFATAELARVLAEPRASQSGSEEQKDKESEDEDTVRAFLALIDQQAGSASCRGDAPYVHHDSCGGAPQPAASATEKESMAAVFEELRIESEECLKALMHQHAQQSEASKRESEMWDRRWKDWERVFDAWIAGLKHGATCKAPPIAPKASPFVGEPPKAEKPAKASPYAPGGRFEDWGCVQKHHRSRLGAGWHPH